MSSDDDAFKVNLWRAFYLGIRATLVARQETVSSASVHSVLERLDAVARGDETILDPASATALGQSLDSDDIAKFHELMRSDRELAQVISAGFHILARRGQES